MELTVNQPYWSAKGNVVFENENWSLENYPNLICILWLLMDFIICTFPVLFVIVSAIVSDRRSDCLTEFPNFEYEKNIIVKSEMVRAELPELHLQDFSTHVSTMCLSKCEYGWGNSETKPKQVINCVDELNSLQNQVNSCQRIPPPKSTSCFTEKEKEHCIFLQLDVDATGRLHERIAQRENPKSSFQNVVLGSSSKSVPVPLKDQTSDVNSDLSWDENFKGIHEDGLHMPQKLWNDPNTYMKPEKEHLQGLEQHLNIMQVETENQTIATKKHKEGLSEIRKECSHCSDSEGNSILKGKNFELEEDEYISVNESQNFQSKDGSSTMLEYNKCNIVDKSTSEIGIQVKMTEEIYSSHMKMGSCLTSSDDLAVFNPENRISRRGSDQKLPVVFVSEDQERGLSISPTEEIVSNGSGKCFVGPKYDTEKQVTEENLENLRTSLTNQDESCFSLEIEDQRVLEEKRTQGSEKKMSEFNKEIYETESQCKTDEDSNNEEKPNISGKLYDELIHIEDKKDLEPVQDSILADDDLSLKTEEKYQPIHPQRMEEHNYSNQKKDNSGFCRNRRRKRSGQIEHRGEKRIRCGSPSGRLFVPAWYKEIKLCQSNNEDEEVKRRQGHITVRNVLQEEGKSFKGKNQELNFKMKTLSNTVSVKKVHACRYPNEELALILLTYFRVMATMDRNTNNSLNMSDLSVPERNMPKEDKSKKNEPHYKENMIFTLLKEIISPWYFFPLLDRFMEFCLPSSLQAFFERLTNGPPISLEERMSHEWLRLQSFNTMPSSARGTAIRLAQNGFYYTGQGTHTRCYACNVGHEGWNNTDNPHEVHRRISPNCPFLGGNPTFPNFPIIPTTMQNGNSTEISATPVIPVVQERTQSSVSESQPFIIPSINHLSTLHMDEMSVPSSAVKDGYRQVPSETAQVEVKRTNPETQGSNVSKTQQGTKSNPSTGTSQSECSPTSSSLSHPQQPTADAENTQYTNPGNFVLIIPTRQEEDPGVDPMPQTISERPKHPEYAPLSSRITSYTSWPAHLDQTPQQMGEAGFFYAGINDYTRCFQCGGGLRNWEPGDNPWIEHARWYPQCAYVLGKRGQKFVNAVLKKQAELLAAQNVERNDSCSTTTTTTIISGTGTSSESPSVQQPISESGKPRYFQNPNENDIANRLIEEMGYQRERVREAILEVKRRRGQQQITIEHALDLLLADEERRSTAGRQNEAATMQELIQESGQLILHDDSSPPPASANTTVPPAPPPATTTESCQHGGHQHQVVGGRSSGQQQSGQTNQSTDLRRIASLIQSRQNTSGPVSIAVDVPSSSPSFGNREGHQSNKSTAANGPSSPPLLEPISLPALDAESLKEEYLRLRDQNVCKICMERKIDMVFLPCGHLMCCQVCGQSLRICPICRAKINGSAKTYLS